MLDLFSGTGSVGRQFALRGYEVFSLDSAAKFKPTFCVDITQWNFREKFPRGFFHAIAAGPPCTEYSPALTTRVREMEKADLLVEKTLEIIKYFNPKIWWIENPKLGKLKSRDVVAGIPYIDVDYCQFSDWGYQKPTRIWCCAQIAKLEDKICDFQNCHNLIKDRVGSQRHRERLGGLGMKFGTLQKFRMPSTLVEYLLSEVEKTPSGKENGKYQHTSSKACSVQRNWVIPDRLQIQPAEFPINKVMTHQGESQLVVQVEATATPHSEKFYLGILIDTGAQANLIRQDLIPSRYFSRSSNPLNLTAANGMPLRGGTRSVILQWPMRAVLDGRPQAEIPLYEAEFFEAEIEAEAILGYDWMQDYKLGIYPHRNALACDSNSLVLLYGMTKEPARKEWRNGMRQVEVTGMEPPEEKRDFVPCFDTRRKFPQARDLPNWEEEWPNFEPEMPKDSHPHPGTPTSYDYRKFFSNPGVNPFHPPQGNHQPRRVQTLSANRIGTPESEFYDFVWKCNMSPPTEGDEYPEFLETSEIQQVAEHLNHCVNSSHYVRHVEAREEENGEVEPPYVEEMRKKIHEDYDGTALGSEPPIDPPVRGRYGYANITLKSDAVPTREKPFVMHGERYEAHTKVTQDWIDHKFIERPTKGGIEWLSQTFVVPKKSPEFPWRGVVDMRGPNSQTRRVSYPLPVIEDILVKQGKNQLFSILDLSKAFHQQPMDPESRPITCCYTPQGIFQWRVNVMGLANASQQFQAMMEDRLEPVAHIATPYIDDILIGTRCEPGEDLYALHEKHIRQVLEILKNENLVADNRKCKFFVKSVEFCGHVLGGGTRKPAPGKLMAVEKWEVPTTISELRGFLGFTNYYATYIQNYANIVTPLQDKLKVPRAEGKKGSKKKIEWDATDQAAFEGIKKVLCSGLSLQRVNPDRPYVLRVDASRYAIGATLEQLVDEERMPTAEDVRAQKNGTSGIFIPKTHRLTEKLGTPGTRNLCNNSSPAKMGILDWFTTRFGTHRSPGH